MKYLSIMILVLISFQTFAQDQEYPTPDFKNAPFFYDTEKNELVELQALPFVIGAKPKGYSGAQAFIYLDGTTTNIKIPSGKELFIVKLTPDIDPRTLMDLNKATVNERSGKREYVVYKKGAFTSEAVNDVIALSFKKIGDGVYLVTIKGGALEPGEYFFSLLENEKSKIVYCFTII